MFKKIILVLCSIMVLLFVSCDEKAGSVSDEEAGKEVAMEVAAQAMAFAGQAMGGAMGGASQQGLSRVVTTVPVQVEYENAPAGLTCTGTMTYDPDDLSDLSDLSDPNATSFDMSVSITTNYNNVSSEDGTWAMNGSLLSLMDISLSLADSSMSMTGTMTGTLTVSDGSNSYPMVFDIVQTQVSSSNEYICTIKGTVTFNTTVITIDESFSFTDEG